MLLKEVWSHKNIEVSRFVSHGDEDDTRGCSRTLFDESESGGLNP
jgi:hypothetical protein